MRGWIYLWAYLLNLLTAIKLCWDRSNTMKEMGSVVALCLSISERTLCSKNLLNSEKSEIQHVSRRIIDRDRSLQPLILVKIQTLTAIRAWAILAVASKMMVSIAHGSSSPATGRRIFEAE